MTQQEKRIKIAEALGYTRGYTENVHWVNDPNGILISWSFMRDVADSAIPDYFGDQNAMHEAEKGLTTEQAHDYYDSLELSLGWEYASATASQRAEAFGRTLNLW